jgi:putative nucleotidyltransferase with HDIG domain
MNPNRNIQHWLTATLMSPNVVNELQDAQRNGFLAVHLPELDALKGVTQNKYHVDDVWDHTLQVVRHVTPKFLHRLTALFHDVGKAQTQRIIDNEVHFHNHENVGVEIVQHVLARTHYSPEVIDAVAVGVRNHMRLKQSGQDGECISVSSLRKFKSATGDHIEMVLDVIDADNISHAPDFNLPRQVAGIRDRLLNLPVEVPRRKLPVNGVDLMQHFNVPSGVLIGHALRRIRDAMDHTPDLTVAQALHVAAEVLHQ